MFPRRPPRLVRSLACGLLFALFAHSTFAAVDAVPGEIIVKYRPGVGSARRAQTLSRLPSHQVVRALDLIGAQHLRVTGMTAEQAIAALRSDPAVEYAEPNFTITADLTPNDPSFTTLWNMHNTGQGGGYANDDIHATQAWDLFTGDPNLLIGVIDTGIDYTHPDLADNVWTNPGEIPGNGIDDDGNGYVDDVHGYDFVNGDGDPMDDHFHGTHVAGTIGAVGNNGVGIVGVNWRCKMVAIKFMNNLGQGSEADAIASLQYAVTVGVKVTNNSWGNMSGGQALLDAINAAGQAGQVFVNAAGNNSWNIDLVPVYPTSYTTPYMITVAATDARDLRASFSNYGPIAVNLGAPGYNVYSCKPGGLYQALNGTSMAAPHVTGVVALAMGRFPYATPQQIRQLVLGSTDPVASMAGITSTGGRLNAYLTLMNGDAVPPSGVADLRVVDTGSTAVRFAWTATGDDSTAGTATRYDLRTSSSPIDASNFALATADTLPPPQAAGAAESFELAGLTCNTTVYAAIRAIDDFGNPGPISNLAVTTTLGIPVARIDAVPSRHFLPPGGSADHVLVLHNTGAGRLDVSVAPSAGGSWLGATPASGRVLAGDSMLVTVHLDAAGLATGEYAGNLEIASNDPVAPLTLLADTLVVSDVLGVGPALPARFDLRLVSANPGARAISLQLVLPAAGPADVSIFDVRGRRVRRLAAGSLPAGVHPLRWDGADESGVRVAAGVYFVRATTAGGSLRRRVTIVP